MSDISRLNVGPLEAFGHAFRGMRQNRSITLGSAARSLGISVVELSDIERGRLPPLTPTEMGHVLGLTCDLTMLLNLHEQSALAWRLYADRIAARLALLR